MGYELFLNQIFLSFLVWYPLVLNPFLPGSGSRSVAFLSGSGSVWKFILDPDPYESSVWIRIRNEFFQLLDPDPSQTNKDPPHCIQVPYGSVILVFSSQIFFLPDSSSYFIIDIKQRYRQLNLLQMITVAGKVLYDTDSCILCKWLPSLGSLCETMTAACFQMNTSTVARKLMYDSDCCVLCKWKNNVTGKVL